MTLNVVIGGGTGFVGRALTNLLKKKGHSVTVISRKGGKPDRISWGYIKEQGLPPDTNAVVNLSGAPIDPLKRLTLEQHKKELVNSRIETTGWLRDAILSSAVKPNVWICASGVGYYPTSTTAIYDEASPGGTGEFFATLGKQWEEAAKLAEGCGNVRQVIVRIGLILGQGGGLIKNMMVPYKLGLGGPAGSGEQYFPWIHIDDVAGIFAHAIEGKNVNGILNAVSPEISTNGEFSKEFARSLNRPVFFRMPHFAAKALMGEDLAVMILKGQNVIPKRTLESGYEFKYPSLKDALKNL